jgi:PAS domain S-box-containing protein
MEAFELKNTSDTSFPHCERLLHLLVKGATEYALILIDPTRRIVYWNEGARRIFGYQESEIIGKHIFTLFTEQDVKHDIAEKEITLAAKQGWAENERWHRRKDGTIFWANGVVTCLKDQNGAIIGYSKVLRDQTLRKETEDRLKSLVADLTQFTYGAAHDLREPLRTLSCYLQLLDRECRAQLSPDVYSHLEFAKKATVRLNALLENLLAYAHASNDIQVFEKTDSSAVFDMAVSNLKTLIDETGASISRGNLPVVNAIPGQLVQVFQNLLSNSIKYRGDKPPRIEVDAKQTGNMWKFCIADNGQGLPTEHKQEVFDAFKRLHENDEIPGSGLGLSICRKIVERHRGKIWIESSGNQGTTLCFTLSS